VINNSQVNKLSSLFSNKKKENQTKYV